MPSFLSSLRHPLSTPTRRLVLANFLLVVCFTATYFVGLIGCATYQLGAGAFEVSALVVLVNVTLVVGGALAGVVTDRIGPRRTLVASLAGFALIGVFALLMPLNYPMLAVASALEGLADGFCGTTVSAYPRFLTNRPRELKRLNSLCGTSVSVAVIVGPLVGGAVTALSTNQVCFATIPVALLLAAALVWATPEALDAMGEQHRDNQQGEKAAASGGFWHQLAEGFRVTFSHGTLRTLFLIYFLGFFAYGAFDSLESLFYRDVLRVGGDWMGWLSACAGVGATAGSLLVVRVPTKRLTLGTLSALLLVTGLGSIDLRGHGKRRSCHFGAARDRAGLWRHASREGHHPPAKLRHLLRWPRDRGHERGHQQCGHPAAARGAAGGKRARRARNALRGIGDSRCPSAGVSPDCAQRREKRSA